MVKIRFAIILVILGLMTSCYDPTLENSQFRKPIWVQNPDYSWINLGSIIDTDLPNVLILGDSIAIQYTGAVHDILVNSYDVRHTKINNRNTYFTLENVDHWIAENPDNQVITWNNGVWDAVDPRWTSTYAPSDHLAQWYYSTPAQYEERIIRIARKLLSTGSRIIFFTTTPLPNAPGMYFSGLEDKFNEIAKRVLPAMGIEVYDLNAYVKSIGAYGYYQSDVHFTEEFNKKIGRFVANAILGK